MTSPNQALGLRGEHLAAQFLRQRGFRVLEHRFRAGRHEIDLVAEDRLGLVFVEVKTRSTRRVGDGMEAIGRAKQQSMATAAHWYLRKHAAALRIQYGSFVPARFAALQLIVRGSDAVVHWADNAFELPFDMG